MNKFHKPSVVKLTELQPGLPAEGAFEVNRLVGRAPVRLCGQVREGVAVVSSVERLAEPQGW